MNIFLSTAITVSDGKNSTYGICILTTLWNIYIKFLKSLSHILKLNMHQLKECKKNYHISKTKLIWLQWSLYKILQASAQFVISPLTYVCNHSLSTCISPSRLKYPVVKPVFNRLTPNDPYMGCTAPLTSKRFILYIYWTNIGTEYFKRALYSPFFSLQNAVCFIMLTCLVAVLFIYYIQVVLKLKKIIPAPKVKQGNKNDKSNYRPVSLLTSFSKIFE